MIYAHIKAKFVSRISQYSRFEGIFYLCSWEGSVLAWFGDGANWAAKLIVYPCQDRVAQQLHCEEKNLPTDSTPCVTDSNYKYTICMRNYVTRTAGCHLDWVDNTTLTNSNQAICVTLDQVLRYQTILTNIRWKIVVQASK